MAEFNTLRPHEALGMQTPASVCAASPRRFTGLPELAYPFRDRDAIVAGNGSIRLHSRTVVISSVFAGQRLGLREVDTGVWPRQLHALRSRMEVRSLQTIDTPFGSRVSPM